MIVLMRDRLWEAYYLNALGDYAIDDYLNTNFSTCASHGRGCIRTQTYERQALGINDYPNRFNVGIEPSPPPPNLDAD